MEPQTDEQLQAAVDALPNPGPRLTPDMIAAVIKDEIYTRLPDSNVTVCQLKLQNGYTVLGVNMGSVDPANYSQELGVEYSYKDAFAKIWQLEGYLLAERLYQEREGGENTKSAAVHLLHKLRQVQEVLRAHAAAGQDEPEDALAQIFDLLAEPLADWGPPTVVPGGFTHVANPVPVKAWPIVGVRGMGDQADREAAVLMLEGRHDFAPTEEMMARHCPQVGDYLVEQEDGYVYINPKAVFERKYRALA